jgi:hypothetical protein
MNTITENNLTDQLSQCLNNITSEMTSSNHEEEHVTSKIDWEHPKKGSLLYAILYRIKDTFINGPAIHVSNEELFDHCFEPYEDPNSIYANLHNI